MIHRDSCEIYSFHAFAHKASHPFVCVVKLIQSSKLSRKHVTFTVFPSFLCPFLYIVKSHSHSPDCIIGIAKEIQGCYVIILRLFYQLSVDSGNFFSCLKSKQIGLNNKLCEINNAYDYSTSVIWETEGLVHKRTVKFEL